MNLFFDLFNNIISAFLKARKEKNKIILNTMYTGSLLFVFAILGGILGNYFIPEKDALLKSKMIDNLAIVLSIISLIVLAIPTFYYENLKIESTEKLIKSKKIKLPKIHMNQNLLGT